jgi:hypothetical protein
MQTVTPANQNLAQTYARVLGGILTLVGILGFIPGITPHAPNGNLIGLFAVDPTHNVIHLLTGIVGLATGFAAGGAYARLYALIFGIVYGLVTIIGFIQGTTVLGIIPVNLADNLLHLVITVASLAVYFTTNENGTAATSAATR